ncbi:hypothetical protein ACTU44_11955 [Thalassospira sp. SM2505]
MSGDIFERVPFRGRVLTGSSGVRPFSGCHENGGEVCFGKATVRHIATITCKRTGQRTVVGEVSEEDLAHDDDHSIINIHGSGPVPIVPVDQGADKAVSRTLDGVKTGLVVGR